MRRPLYLLLFGLAMLPLASAQGAGRGPGGKGMGPSMVSQNMRLMRLKALDFAKEHALSVSSSGIVFVPTALEGLNQALVARGLPRLSAAAVGARFAAGLKLAGAPLRFGLGGTVFGLGGGSNGDYSFVQAAQMYLTAGYRYTSGRWNVSATEGLGGGLAGLKVQKYEKVKLADGSVIAAPFTGGAAAVYGLAGLRLTASYAFSRWCNLTLGAGYQYTPPAGFASRPAGGLAAGLPALNLSGFVLNLGLQHAF